MNQLSTEERAAIVRALCEGNSMRAIGRMFAVGRNTIARLITDLGTACAAHSDASNRKLQCKQVQCDEIWAFIYAKAKNLPKDKRETWGYGDAWTWTAIDAETKLMVSWMVGKRDGQTALLFMRDVASRIVGRPQINTDGLGSYKYAVPEAFWTEVDHGVIQKHYGPDASGGGGRYSPPVCTGATRVASFGNPDMSQVSTSYVERANLTMRMGMRRFTRLTNGHSKKIEQHECMVALFFTFYNFCRKHESLEGRTPAQAAGIAQDRWTIEQLVGLLGTYTVAA